MVVHFQIGRNGAFFDRRLHWAFVKNSHATGDVTGLQAVGGLLGYAELSFFLRTHATGSVTGKRMVGGLFGYNKSYLIINSYATGDVTGYYRVGGLVGENENHRDKLSPDWRDLSSKEIQ